MADLSDLMDELKRSALAREAMDLLEMALARRSIEERSAFWRAVDLYYFARKAPPDAAGAEARPAPPAA